MKVKALTVPDGDLSFPPVFGLERERERSDPGFCFGVLQC